MVSYKCDICDKKFTHKNDCKRHINKKTPCKSKAISKPNLIVSKSLSIVSEIEVYTEGNSEKETHPTHPLTNVNLKCNYCQKTFSRKDNLIRHIKEFCKVVKQEINIPILTEVKDLKVEIMELKKEINQLKEKNINVLRTNNINNGTINNNYITTNINIKINPYGQEDNSHLNDEDYKRIINKGFKSIPELIKLIHFNQDKPENHNIYISNMRDKYTVIYNGKKWELRDRDDTIQELYIDKKDILMDKYEQLEQELPEFTKKKFNRFINDQKSCKVESDVKEGVKLTLYNNRDVIEEIKNVKRMRRTN